MKQPTQATKKTDDRNSLKAEAAEITRQLKIKSLSGYTKIKLEKRYNEISDILCGFTETDNGQQVEGFTGGEWELDGLAIVSSLSERLEICVVTADEDISYKEAQANAALIAKAPDMYRENIKLKRENEELTDYANYIGDKIANGDTEILSFQQWLDAGKPDAGE